MDRASNIDTVQIGYEETAYISEQPLDSHTPATSPTHSEVQDALSLANMLKQLREQKLHEDVTAGGLQPYA